MFTTLNLTLSSQISTESGVLPAENADGLPVFDATTFAASLSLSLDSGLAPGESDGSPLPLAGIELPVEIEAEPELPVPEALPEGVAADAWMPEGGTDSAVPWPPGLEPAKNADADVASRSLSGATGEVFETAEPPAVAPAPVPVQPTRTQSETPIAAATPAPTLGRDSTDRRTPSTDLASLAVVDAPESADPDIQARLSAERPASEALRPPPAVQPEAAPVQRSPEWSLAGSGASPGPDSNALNALANAANNSSVNQRVSTTPNLASLPTINTPVTDPGFGDSIADRVLMMASNKLGNAEIRLTPAELGPLRVQVSVDDGMANVQFHATQVATREALEQAMPRLRDMLAENGLSLGQASVSDDGSRQGVRDHAADGGRAAGADAADNGVEIEAETDRGGRSARLSNALVDTFA